jgi:hypothetical protein
MYGEEYIEGYAEEQQYYGEEQQGYGYESYGGNAYEEEA